MRQKGNKSWLALNPPRPLLTPSLGLHWHNPRALSQQHVDSRAEIWVREVIFRLKGVLRKIRGTRYYVVNVD